MTPNRHIATPLDKAANREPFLTERFWEWVSVRFADEPGERWLLGRGKETYHLSK